MTARETIFAPSTAPGRAGIAVVRVSGPQAGQVLQVLSRQSLPAPRLAALRLFVDPHSGRELDRGLALWFPAPASFTGENVVELHLHGGRAVIQAVLSALAVQPGVRPAEPGEFTRRAFEAGRLDLSAVEGLADLINAETEAQRQQALRQMRGALADLVETWRRRLLRVSAQVEAMIDFPEDDLPSDLPTQAQIEISDLIEEIVQYIEASRPGERLREGLQVAIVGPPNAGKSTLLNALANRDVAIVSDFAGTTRDVIEVHLDLGGYPLSLADTAGLRDLKDGEHGAAAVEREGMRRSRERAREADFKIAVFDVQETAATTETLSLLDSGDLIVLNKIDRLKDRGGVTRLDDFSGFECHDISAATGEGMADFLAALESKVAEYLNAAMAAPVFTRLRHREALRDCRAALDRALHAALPELVAEDLRLARQALGRITGDVDVEDLLDVLFGEFCIGK